MSESLQLAVAAHQAGNLAEAERLYRATLAAEPRQPDALALLGVLVSGKGDHAAALALIAEALRLDPQAALFHLHHGNILMAAGEDATAAFRRAVALQPTMAAAHYNLGNALRVAGAWAEAEAAYVQTLRLAPEHAEARNNLALCHEQAGRLDDALRELQETVARHEDYAEGWLNLCNIAEKTGDYALSCRAGVKAAALTPQNASAWLGLGVALNRLERHEEALEAYRRALACRPDWLEAWDNIGQSYQFLNRLDEAEAAYRKTVELAGQGIADEDTRRPDEREYGNRHWHLALLELLKGDYRRGFARYRARFGEVGGLCRPAYRQPVWQGEPLCGKTILVMDEQGMGDCLMMARYLPLLKAQGARVKFLVHAALAPLFAGWAGADAVIAHGQPVGDFDCYASIFDLPYGFGTVLETIPNRTPYLPAIAPVPLEAGDGLKVGVVWAGAPKHKHDGRRSVPLAQFATLFDAPEAWFFSLNRDVRRGDAELLTRYPVTDLTARLHHFGDLAACVAAMDMIVTCDTATAHLAGGMGKPVWTLLPFAPDWRWLTARTDSPWYPTMRLFRQPRSGDWASVMAAVRDALGRRG